MEEAPQVHLQKRREIAFGIVSERLGREGAGVVNQGVDAPEALNCFLND